ncbi:MAG TPA: prolyl aminopeptidase [Gammaproteobacteria bacterium]
MDLFPEISPYRTLRLDVGEGHELYIEESGAPAGLPVVFLHGGPGGGSSPYHRRFFDPGRYRIVVFDQRGCGRSTPYAALTHNTTWDLVSDIEKIREELHIDQWLVFGGSWGSTLALVYAQRHPERVLGLVLRGIFLCRDRDIQWFYQSGGASEVFPEAWEQFVSPIPVSERADMVAAYHRRLTGDDNELRMVAARAWSVWEGTTATLRQDEKTVAHFSDPAVALALARIENHYFVNHCFLDENQLLAGAGGMQGIPGIIVHGRYDIVCPVSQAWALHAAWPNSQLTVVDDAGHAATEPGIRRALVAATQTMAERLR